MMSADERTEKCSHSQSSVNSYSANECDMSKQQDDVEMVVHELVEHLLQHVEAEQSGQKETVPKWCSIEDLLSNVLLVKEVPSSIQKEKGNDLFTSAVYSDPWSEYEKQVWERIMKPSRWEKFKAWVSRLISYCCLCFTCCSPSS